MTLESKIQDGVTVSVGSLVCQLCSERKTVAFMLPGNRAISEEEIDALGAGWVCDQCLQYHRLQIPN